MKKREIPCYECKEREVGCHSRCERYKEWRAWKDEAKLAEDKARVAEYQGRGYAIGVIEKNKKQKKLSIKNRQS